MPVVVAARKYDLQLAERFTASDVLVKLRETTDLWSWMQQTDNRSLPEVDRVIVHIEQMSVKNRHWKQFGIQLGQLLQRSVVDNGECIVKLSSPHLFRAGGVVEHIGEQIVQELNLVTIAAGRKRARPASPAQTSAADCDETENDGQDDDVDYRRKKRMSSDVFRYFVQADSGQEENLQVKVASDVREMWLSVIAEDSMVKLDDLGDALLHALGDILCGASKYRQLVPSTVSLHNNRTVVVSVCRDYMYWTVINCTWNTFEVEDIGFTAVPFSSKYFNTRQTIADIKATVLNQLRTAVTEPSGGDTYRSVDVIKMVVKQLKSYQDFTGKQAGALTHSTMQAMRDICDEAAGPNSTLCERKDKVLGSVYIRTQPATGQKFQVISSTGKQTNAMLCCLNWMHENAPDFVKNRTAFMDENTKLCFFERLQCMAQSPDNRLEHLILSERARVQLASEQLHAADPSMKCMLAYLILIAVNKNEQRVKAVAANYRRAVPRKSAKSKVPTTSKADTEAAESMDVESEPTPSTAETN